MIIVPEINTLVLFMFTAGAFDALSQTANKHRLGKTRILLLFGSSTLLVGLTIWTIAQIALKVSFWAAWGATFWSLFTLVLSEILVGNDEEECARILNINEDPSQ